MRDTKRKEERRKYLRLAVYHLVKYRVISDKSPHSAPLLASIKDIGGGGICLLTDKPIPQNTKLELQINFPVIKKPIFTFGRVIWCKQMGKLHRYTAGVEFVDMKTPILKVIDDNIKFVFQKLKNKK